jgi:hypothetical protein
MFIMKLVRKPRKISDESRSINSDNPKKYKYRLGQEVFPLDLTGTTNLGECGGMSKQSKITEGWGKN